MTKVLQQPTFKSPFLTISSFICRSVKTKVAQLFILYPPMAKEKTKKNEGTKFIVESFKIRKNGF